MGGASGRNHVTVLVRIPSIALSRAVTHQTSSSGIVFSAVRLTWTQRGPVSTTGHFFVSSGPASPVSKTLINFSRVRKAARVVGRVQTHRSILIPAGLVFPPGRVLQREEGFNDKRASGPKTNSGPGLHRGGKVTYENPLNRALKAQTRVSMV